MRCLSHFAEPRRMFCSLHLCLLLFLVALTSHPLAVLVCNGTWQGTCSHFCPLMVSSAPHCDAPTTAAPTCSHQWVFKLVSWAHSLTSPLRSQIKHKTKGTFRVPCQVPGAEQGSYYPAPSSITTSPRASNSSTTACTHLSNNTRVTSERNPGLNSNHITLGTQHLLSPSPAPL